jgi:hypothetical protein
MCPYLSEQNLTLEEAEVSAPAPEPVSPADAVNLLEMGDAPPSGATNRKERSQ